MTDKKYLSEAILQFVLRQLDDLKQHSPEPPTVNLSILQAWVEQAQQQ